MRKIIAALAISIASTAVYGHELTSVFPDTVQVYTKGETTTVEYCPDNTCEVFTLSGRSASLPLQDFVLAYLYGVSDYVYLKAFQSNSSSPSVRSVLAKYRRDCPQPSTHAAARCVVTLLAKRHAIRATFVRYDEGERNVVPIPLDGYRHGT
ncbi:hypothetical protein [Caldimonas sp. KR1-144]|uniref:hypothetical protein n=1 Tax=Caldimonas sp. KR1-144 TaxID=3400911 RepID=UPI003BFF7EEF